MSVFGALNRFISRLDSDGQAQNSGSRHAALGFQVLRNTNSELAIEPWYDFVVGINGRLIDNVDCRLFMKEVHNCAGSSVALTLWSAKGQQMRDLSISVPQSTPSLGLTLQWVPLSNSEDVWHILEVIPDSPADLAGLLPYGDYVVGTPEGSVRGESGLRELVEDYLSRPLRLYVYNHEYGVTRQVTITPSRNWGGEGALGCVLGFGALHRLPPPLAEPPAAPGDTLFETQRTSSGSAKATPIPAGQPLWQPTPGANPAPGTSYLVPATMSVSLPYVPTPTSTPARASRKKKQAASPNSAFDEVWRESEQKSKEEDPPAKTKPGLVPPPPMSSAQLEVATDLPVPPTSGEPRQTRSPAPIIDDEDE